MESRGIKEGKKEREHKVIWKRKIKRIMGIKSIALCQVKSNNK